MLGCPDSITAVVEVMMQNLVALVIFQSKSRLAINKLQASWTLGDEATKAVFINFLNLTNVSKRVFLKFH